MLKRKNSDTDENNVKRAAVEIRHDEDETFKTEGSSEQQSDSISDGQAGNETDTSSKPNIVSSHKLNVEVDPSTYIHLRFLVNLKEAVIIIGRGGSTIAKIREASGIKLNVSDHAPGITERVVNLKGAAEHVAKAAGLIVRSINNEPFDTPSATNAKHYTLKVLIPHTMMGAMIGKGGSRFREIEEASAAKLKALDLLLPQSTDRILQIYGVADAIHIAIYYVCTTYLSHKEYLRNQRPTFYNPISALSPPNYYSGMPPQGNYGNHYGQRPGDYGPGGPRGPPGGYYNAPMQHIQPYNSGSSRYLERMQQGAGGMSNPATRIPITGNPSLQNAQNFAQNAERGKELKQDILIPNDYVGSVIGKGGAKINHLRQFSGSNIKINEPTPNSTERSLTIIGLPEANETAIYLINNVIENEKKRNRDRPYNNHNKNNNNGASNSNSGLNSNGTNNGGAASEGANTNTSTNADQSA